MKIIKENKVCESMSPNEKMFYLLGKGESDKAVTMIEKQAMTSLKKKFPLSDIDFIEEMDEYQDLVMLYEKSYIKGISENLHATLDHY